MELIVQVHTEAALAAALESGAAGVAVPLPQAPDPEWWSDLRIWQAATRRRHLAFYVIWDRLVAEADFPRALERLDTIAQMSPEALALRDPGLTREARRRHPQLLLHAAGNWGFQNSPGLKLAENLGFSRAVLSAPASLKDLALLRRQSSLPLTVELPPACSGYAGLCLVEAYPGLDCARCCGLRGQEDPASLLMPALEMLSGLCQLGIEAVQISGASFPSASLGRVVGLYRSVWEAPATDRARVLAAAREVLAALGPGPATAPCQEDAAPGTPLPPSPARRNPSPPQPLTGVPLWRGSLWLEARGYPEAAALAREWRDPLLIELTRDNYAGFLPELRRWTPRRLIWRLPGAIRESSLSFYRKALETLRQGGYSRVVAGDWDAVALARAAGCEVYGDQALGVRNTPALETARQAGVARVCLPPASRPADWQKWLATAPPGRFWGYLYHFPPLAVCPRAATAPPSPGPGLRWVTYGENICLCRDAAEHLEKAGDWLHRQGVTPLVVSLPRSQLPWGKVPVQAAPGPRRPSRPRK
jgi:collagenase-like PrtC family protease